MRQNQMSITATARSAGLVAAVAAACLLSACGQERSPEAYCRAFYETAAPIREGYVDAADSTQEDPLGSLATLLSVPGDLVAIMSSMADHAPDEIKGDTEVVRDAFKDQQDALGDALSDPLGAIGSSIGAGLTSSGSISRVDAYLGQHCPVDSALAQEIINGAG